MKRFIAILCTLALMLACMPIALAEEAQPAPKYVFMFIGDGMGNPQVTATQYYKGAVENPASEFPVPADLSFTTFPYLGMVTTYDASSFCPDSASIASGEKTLSGVINYDVTLTTPLQARNRVRQGSRLQNRRHLQRVRGSCHPGSLLRQAAQPQRLL